MPAASKMTVGQKLNRITTASGLCFLVCVVVAITSIGIINSDLKSFINNEYHVVTNQGDVIRGNQGTGRNLCKMILASIEGDQDAVETYYQESKSYLTTLEQGLSKLDDASSVDQATVEEALSQESTFQEVLEQLHTLCVDGRGDDAWEMYKAEYAPAIDAIRNSLNQVIEDANTSADEHIARNNQLTIIFYFVVVLTAVAMFVLLYFLARRTAKGITDPIAELEVSSNHLRQGRLDSDIHCDADDELGSLCQNFNTSCEILSSYVKEIADFADAMNHGKLNYQQTVDFVGDFKPIGESLTQLSQTLSADMGKIRSSAEQINRGAEQISAMGQTLSQSAVEQASSVRELASTVNTVSDHITENATNALQVRDNAKALYDRMSQYAVLMSDVNQNMVDTRAMTDKVRGIVHNLEAISFQTNILALNAAVEAARAGDAGRGFSVISSKIRELASEATKASTNTSILLSSMIEKIVTSADMSVRAVNSLDTIREEGKQTADKVDMISRASNSQATAIAQVRQSINELSMNIQSISATAEESAASAEELTGQMKLLNQMVDTFELRNNS